MCNSEDLYEENISGLCYLRYFLFTRALPCSQGGIKQFSISTHDANKHICDKNIANSL